MTEHVSTLFRKYFRHSTMFHSSEEDEECDEKCHHDSMCAIAFLRVEDMQGFNSIEFQEINGYI